MDGLPPENIRTGAAVMEPPEKVPSYIVPKETEFIQRNHKYDTTLTPVRHHVVVQAMAEGMPFKRAYELAGVAKGTADDWLDKGDVDPGSDNVVEPYFSFVLDCKQASAVHTYELLLKLKSVDDPAFWAAWITQLERKDPEFWSRRTLERETPSFRFNFIMQQPAASPALPDGNGDAIEGHLTVQVAQP